MPNSANTLLASLPSGDFERLSPHLQQVPMTLGHVVHKQGEHIRHVYFPGGGACALIKVMGNQRGIQIATVGNEGLIGAGVFFGDVESVADTRVHIEGGDGHVLPVDIFISEMERRSGFYARVLDYYHALMTQVMQATVCNGLHSAQQRCCRWLLLTHDRTNGNALPVTHQFLADMLGLRRPTVTLIARNLQHSGLIDHRRGSLIIIDRMGLEKVTCECYRTMALLLPTHSLGRAAQAGVPAS